MAAPRIYLPVPLREGTIVELDQRSRRHAVQVLRLQQGAEIVLFNQAGDCFGAVLETATRHSASALLRGRVVDHTESPLHVTLAQGISRGERMDYTIQKSVELGVKRIQPLWTRRCQVRLSGERLERRLAHWRGVVIAACEQTGRSVIPDVLPPLALPEWLARIDRQGLNLLLDPACSASFKAMARPAGATSLLVGPEGGLSPEEKEAALASGYVAVRMGPRVLRTETAALVALSILQWNWGDLA